jgi:hypothetical protein
LGIGKGTSRKHTFVIAAYIELSHTLLCPRVKQQGGQKPKGPLEALRPKLQVFNLTNIPTSDLDMVALLSFLWLDNILCVCLINWLVKLPLIKYLLQI